jgi:hypothetical protein
MHTSLCVIGVLSDLEVSVVLGLGFRGVEALHELATLYRACRKQTLPTGIRGSRAVSGARVCYA